MHIETISPFDIGVHIVCFDEEFVADKPDNGGDTKANANTVDEYHI